MGVALHITAVRRKRHFRTGVKKLLDLFNRAQLGLIHVDHHPEDDQPTHQFTSNYGFRLIPAWKYRPLLRLIPHWTRLIIAFHAIKD